VEVANMAAPNENDAYEFIFVASFLDKTGKRIYARTYGKKAFRIRVKKKSK
jgi:hypothetical protein